jgi:hypothetical protein
VAVAPVEGLEQTRLAGGTLRVQASLIPELEGTQFAPAPEPLMADLVPDLETTAAVQVWSWDEAPVAELPDLERGRVVDTEPRTAAITGPVTCRYCRTVQNDGLLCERCGMRLPRTWTPGTPTAAIPSGEGDWVRCPACAVPVRAGQKCMDCGISV